LIDVSDPRLVLDIFQILSEHNFRKLVCFPFYLLSLYFHLVDPMLERLILLLRLDPHPLYIDINHRSLVPFLELGIKGLLSHPVWVWASY
jgi:hypothetical protein